MRRYLTGVGAGLWLAAAVGVSALLSTAVAAAPLSPAAQRTVIPSGAPAAAQEVVMVAEDVTILKALSQLGFTRGQLSQLLPALRGAQERLADLDTREDAKLSGLRDPLEQAKRDLLAGSGSGARAQEQFVSTQTASAQRRAALRAELVSSLRRTLDSILTPQQSAKLAENGQAVLLSQRAAGWRGGRGGGIGPGGGAAGGGGPGGWVSGRLDRVRQMSPAEFEQESGRLADRMGGRSSPQFQQYTAFMQNVRNMPQSQYVLQRDQLATQSMRQMTGFGPNMAGTSADAANAFVDRYLLSSRAPAVIADRLKLP